jgi:endonuclease/exonuclease/phosphatase family metal-dependent hydrolase
LIRALTWNLFHGRDMPPDRALLTWRSRLLRLTERNETHAQVNRDLRREFSALLAQADWDVALLQECPPRWSFHLSQATDAQPHRVLTSRNSLAPLRSALARLNPDLIASGEGGSNLTLVRPALGRITHTRELELRRRPERRAMAFARTSHGLCVANLHTSNDRPDLAAEEVVLAAGNAVEWSAGSPLLFGGDLNLRPADAGPVFDLLRDRFELDGPSSPRAIDHLLVRGLEIREPPTAWAPERREVQENGRAVRLSDHPPVAAAFAKGAGE